MIQHAPDDLTVTVTAEVTLAALQQELAKRGQWLPVDPPGAGDLTIRALIDANASGPRRFGFGTIREQLLGLRVCLPDGRELRAGGQVVKNVAGYDLCKLFVGAHGRLGAIHEATFKLRPLPEAEQFVQHRCDSLDTASTLIEAIVAAELNPVVLDLVSPATVVVGFAGSREEVDWQLAKAGELGLTEAATLGYDRAFPHKVSVLPSKLVDTIQQMGLTEFVARAGNGVIGLEQSLGSAGAPSTHCACSGPSGSPSHDRMAGRSRGEGEPPGEPQLGVRRLEQRLEEAFGGHR
ncbi:FAD-binding oxidoreductase [bacterium]|nr:FAD-binding oxidoreductase [bacterium]